MVVGGLAIIEQQHRGNREESERLMDEMMKGLKEVLKPERFLVFQYHDLVDISDPDQLAVEARDFEAELPPELVQSFGQIEAGAEDPSEHDVKNGHTLRKLGPIYLKQGSLQEADDIILPAVVAALKSADFRDTGDHELALVSFYDRNIDMAKDFFHSALVRGSCSTGSSSDKDAVAEL